MEYISAHGLVEGDRLPSERELCVLLDVSRTTLRSALAQLVAEHVVESRPGAGSFVCPSRPTNHLDDLSGFSEIVRKTGAEPRSRVIGSSIIACPDEIAGRLNLAAGDHVFELRRVRGVEDVAARFCIPRYRGHRFRTRVAHRCAGDSLWTGYRSHASHRLGETC